MALRHKVAALVAACGMMMNSAQASEPLFYDTFDGKGKLSSAWQVATWANGHPFGCTFASSQVSKNRGLLNLSFESGTGKCAEVRTFQHWQYGSFIVKMKPANVRGTISSFFLYSGQAGTGTHHEIDIEFIGGTTLLHTNVWIAGQQSPLDIDLSHYGIDPYKGLRDYSIEWRPDSIAWFVYSDDKRWIEVRRVNMKLEAPMQLMMNAWYGNNQDWAVYFPGYYSGAPGTAQYDSVWIGR